MINSNNHPGDCDELSQNILIAAPPYHQRIAPLQQSLNNFTLLTQQRAIMHNELATNNTFGTLQVVF